MKIEQSMTKKLVLTNLERLDPVTVFIEDFEPGKGRITMCCYGQSWTSYWGGMSGDDIATFFCRAPDDYLVDNLSKVKARASDRKYLLKIINAVKGAFTQIKETEVAA